MKASFDKLRNPIAGAPVDPPSDQPSDDALLKEVHAKLASDGRLEDEEFDIVVENAAVTLTGTISREFLRVLIDAHVKAVPGVRVVRDQLEVSEPGPMTGPPE